MPVHRGGPGIPLETPAFALPQDPSQVVGDLQFRLAGSGDFDRPGNGFTGLVGLFHPDVADPVRTLAIECEEREIFARQADMEIIGPVLQPGKRDRVGAFFELGGEFSCRMGIAVEQFELILARLGAFHDCFAVFLGQTQDHGILTAQIVDDPCHDGKLVFLEPVFAGKQLEMPLPDFQQREQVSIGLEGECGDASFAVLTELHRGFVEIGSRGIGHRAFEEVRCIPQGRQQFLHFRVRIVGIDQQQARAAADRLEDQLPHVRGIACPAGDFLVMLVEPDLGPAVSDDYHIVRSREIGSDQINAGFAARGGGEGDLGPPAPGPVGGIDGRSLEVEIHPLQQLDDVPGAVGFHEEQDGEFRIVQPFEMGRHITWLRIILPGILVAGRVIALFQRGEFSA